MFYLKLEIGTRLLEGCYCLICELSFVIKILSFNDLDLRDKANG